MVLYLDFNFSKKDMVWSKYTGMSARRSDLPDFWRTEFKGCIPANTSRNIKGAEATCVEIATEMKKCFTLKDMLNFNIPWNF